MTSYRKIMLARLPRGDEGWTMIESIFWTLILVLVLSIVALCGRIVHAENQAGSAAADAARAASLQRTTASANQAAAGAAQQSLTDAGISCFPFTVTVSGSIDPGGVINVRVSCTASLSDLAITGVPGSKTLTAQASAPIEITRSVSLGLGISEGSAALNPSAGSAS